MVAIHRYSDLTASIGLSRAAESAPTPYGLTSPSEPGPDVLGDDTFTSGSSHPGPSFTPEFPTASRSSTDAGIGRLIELPRREPNPFLHSEYQALLVEHRTLAARKVTDGLSRSETRHLELLRWRLDQLREIIHPRSSELDPLVSAQEELAKQVADLAKQIDSARLSRRRGQKR